MIDRNEVMRRAHLQVRQTRRYSGQHSLRGDLLILVSSWEGRCLEVLNAQHERYPVAALIRFSEIGHSGRRSRNDQVLLGAINDISASPTDIESKSLNSFA